MVVVERDPYLDFSNAAAAHRRASLRECREGAQKKSEYEVPVPLHHGNILLEPFLALARNPCLAPDRQIRL
jgi:hypothetical protein